MTDEWVASTAAHTLATVSEARATWQVWHVRAEAHRRARAAGIALADLHRAVEKVVDEVLSPTRSIPLGAEDPVEEPARLRRSDGASVYSVAGSRLYTSRAVIDAEQLLVAAAGRHDGRRLTYTEVDLALLESTANRVTLNDMQAQMVRELATSGARVQLAIAPAGSGKTTAMRTLASAWTANGGRIIGLAPSAAASATLRAAIGTRTDTLAKLTHCLDTGLMPKWVRGIDAATLIIIDEAGMAGTGDLAQAVGYILRRGGSVRLVGDDQQLASIAAGGVLRDIADAAGVVTLSQLMRFTDPAEAAATLALRTGDPASLGFYLDNGRVHVGDEATVADHAYQAWSTDRAAGLDSVMLAPTRDLVSTLNRRARADRLAALDGKPGREVRLADGNLASPGDPIITRRNDRELVITATDWVKNGDRWTITKVQRDGALRARHHGTRRTITLPADYVNAHAELGYACTVHGAQGITADSCHTVAGGEENRQLFYVAMTRGRAANHVYLVTAGDGDQHNVIRPESLFPPTATDILTGILARDEAQRSASSLTRELADPSVLLHDAVGRYHDALGFAAEQVLGAQRLAGIDAAAEALRDGLTDAPAWPTLRGHLALLAVEGHDPIAALTAAVTARELDTALDPAAVLDWRLADGTRTGGGPLPWLPSIPAGLRDEPPWGGGYLQARAAHVVDLGAQVAAQAAAHTPTSAPSWAARLLDPAHDHLRAELAVWRAAIGIPAHDRRPAGAPQLASAAASYHAELGARAETVLGDPHQASRVWAPLVDRLDDRISVDPYWPELADRLAALDRAGIDVAGMVTAAATAHLPDEQPAAALWWRMSRHLSPAALTATARSGACTLRPSWTPVLCDILGGQRVERVLSDPAWPALVAAVDTAVRAGWDPGDVLRSAAELARLERVGGPANDADLACALVWRVALLGDPEPLEAETIPPDPQADAFAPPEDHDAATLPPGDLADLAEVAAQPPFDPDYEPQPLDGELHAAMQAGAALRGPLEPTEAQQWAALDEEYKWATAPVTRERLVELNQQAADFYASHYPGSWAATTMRERLGTDLVDDPRFTPGYAPAGFTALTTYLRRLGATDAELLAAGLAKSASTGRLIDVFRDRLTLPIHGSGGEIHGFIGRRNPAVSDDDPYAGPKYLNTAETDLFSKGAQLFGLHEGHDALAHGATPALVEGPLDAIAVTISTGGTHVGAAPLGTAFTDRQADQLLPYIGPDRPGVAVATDADHAGQQAAARAYWQLTARGDNPAHVLMTPGYDPAQLLERHGPTAVRAALSDQQPLATTLIDAGLEQLGDGSHASPEAIVDTTRAVAEIIGALPPEHWTQHITTVTRRLDTAPGAVHLAVIDAGHAWTSDPRTLAAAHICQVTRRPAREPALTTAARTPARDSAAGLTLAGARPATETWAALVDSIDPALTSEPDWPVLAAALDRAHTAGHNVTQHLPRLATEQPLPEEHRARALHYRLITEVPQASTPTPDHVAARAAGDTEMAQPERPDDRWRELADSIDPRLAASPDWPRLAAALEQAARDGYDVNLHLPRLAAAEPLPDQRPGLELQYRILAETDIAPAEPADTDLAPRTRGKQSPAPPPPVVDRSRPSGPRR